MLCQSHAAQAQETTAPPLFECASLRILDAGAIEAMSEDDCVRFLANLRWDGDEQQCPACGTWAKHYYVRTRRQYTCCAVGCQRRFSYRTGTALENCNLAAQQVILALNLIACSAEAVEASELAAIAGVCQKTAKRLLDKAQALLLPDPPSSATEVETLSPVDVHEPSEMLTGFWLAPMPFRDCRTLTIEHCGSPVPTELLARSHVGRNGQFIPQR